MTMSQLDAHKLVAYLDVQTIASLPTNAKCISSDCNIHTKKYIELVYNFDQLTTDLIFIYS